MAVCVGLSQPHFENALKHLKLNHQTTVGLRSKHILFVFFGLLKVAL